MSIPVLIISGFLGAGKTTFLRQLLPLCADAGVRPALIINEVGTVGVDGQLLADLHAEQTQLVGGCVCCTLQSQLAATVHDLLDRDAGDILIIECSGLSNPLDVISTLSTPALVSRVVVSQVICLLDASRVEKMLQLVELAKTQASAASMLLLNKADRLDGARCEEVMKLAHTVNPHATVYWAEYGYPGRTVLLDLLSTNAPTWTIDTDGHAHGTHDHHSHSLPASFCTVALPLPASMSRDNLEALLQSLPENVIRAKGFALLHEEGWHVLQKVYDSVDVYFYADLAPSTGAMLICIGQHLEAEKLKMLLFHHCPGT